MRVWDISPGYLSRDSLINEHREVHDLASFLVNRKAAHAVLPEVLRWVGRGWALRLRHRQLSCEMALRGLQEGPLVRTRSGKGSWPETYIDSPAQQFEHLKHAYASDEKGRIPLPENAQQLWSHHKYSVLARDPNLYKQIGPLVSKHEAAFSDLSRILTESLRQAPTQGGIRNAVQHMWGYVARGYQETKQGSEPSIESWSTRRLLLETQRMAMAQNVIYIRSSTALSELMVWL
jgi:hypothetical protein